MACVEDRKEINGREYYVVQMPPDKAIPIQLKLVKIFGGSVGMLGGAMRGDFAQQAEALSRAMTELFKNASEQEIFALLKEVTETAKVDGERVQFSTTFAGEHMADCYKVFFWVLGVNFSSFFGERGLSGFLTQFRTTVTEIIKQNAQAKPPQTSTHISGSPLTPDSADSVNSKTAPIQ